MHASFLLGTKRLRHHLQAQYFHTDDPKLAEEIKAKRAAVADHPLKLLDTVLGKFKMGKAIHIDGSQAVKD